MRTALKAIGIAVAMLVACSLPSYAEQTIKCDFEKTLDNGDLVQREVASGCCASISGEKRDNTLWDTYTLYLTRKGSKSKQVVDKYSAPSSVYDTYKARILDVRIEEKTASVAYIMMSTLVVTAYKEQADDTWKCIRGCSITHNSEVYPRWVVSAKLVGSNRIDVEINNGDIEEWSFAARDAKLISVKSKYGPSLKKTEIYSSTPEEWLWQSWRSYNIYLESALSTLPEWR